MPSLERKFEVAVYNQAVRRFVEQGEHHPQLKDTWADIHYVTIPAEDAEQARRKMLSRYPADKGFVIENVSAVRED